MFKNARVQHWIITCENILYIFVLCVGFIFVMPNGCSYSVPGAGLQNRAKSQKKLGKNEFGIDNFFVYRPQETTSRYHSTLPYLNRILASVMFLPSRFQLRKPELTIINFTCIVEINTASVSFSNTRLSISRKYI